MEIINYLLENAQTYIEIALAAVGLFALIAAVTPNKTDDSIVAYLTKAVHFLGANVGKAKSVPVEPKPK